MKSFLEEHCQKEWLTFIDFHKETKHYKAGEYICVCGQSVEGLHIVTRGRAKVVRACEQDTERVIRLAGDGDILGHRGFGGNWTYPISSIALTETETMFIPLPAFNVLAKANAPFVYRIMMFFAEELRLSEARSLQIPARNRIAKALWCNYDAFGFDKEVSDQLSFTLTRRDLATFAQTTYETVIRVLSDFNKKGIIRLDGKAIAIPDLPVLEALTKEPEKARN